MADVYKFEKPSVLTEVICTGDNYASTHKLGFHSFQGEVINFQCPEEENQKYKLDLINQKIYSTVDETENWVERFDLEFDWETFEKYNNGSIYKIEWIPQGSVKYYELTPMENIEKIQATMIEPYSMNSFSLRIYYIDLGEINLVEYTIFGNPAEINKGETSVIPEEDLLELNYLIQNKNIANISCMDDGKLEIKFTLSKE